MRRRNSQGVPGFPLIAYPSKMNTKIVVALVLAHGLSACALKAIDYSIHPQPDWPVKREEIVRLPAGTIPPACTAYAAGIPSCAVANFRTGVCTIYLTTDDPAVLEHERWHCRGYDHVGEANRSRNAWEDWKRRNSR